MNYRDKSLVDKLLERLNAAAESNKKEGGTTIRNRKWTAEEWYEQLRARWYFHPDSWFMRLKDGYDDEGCSAHNGCVKECRFYEERGTFDDSEVARAIEILSEVVSHENKEQEAPAGAVNSSAGAPASTAAAATAADDDFFNSLKAKPFWIWNPHRHFLEYLKTQGQCCWNHAVGEPEKRYGAIGVKMPIF